MIKRYSKILSTAIVAFLVSWNCNAQVYSQSVYPGGVSYYPSHLIIGSPPFRLGLQEYSYSTDVAGVIITRPDWRTPRADDIFHDCTVIYFGPLEFHVPMRPWLFLVVGGFVFAVVLTLADFALKFFKRKRYEARVA
jgi:hypothetical protein